MKDNFALWVVLVSVAWAAIGAVMISVGVELGYVLIYPFATFMIIIFFLVGIVVPAAWLSLKIVELSDWSIAAMGGLRDDIEDSQKEDQP